MASKFLKNNFKSMNMTDEEKEKMNQKIKEISGTVSEKEMELLSKLIPKEVSSTMKLQKLLEEEKQ